jgi:hypothetical protein
MNRKPISFRRRRAILFWPIAPGLLLVGFSSLCGAQATDGVLEGWRITPRLSVGATYSDNIRLAPADEAEGDWVWQVDPGISVRKQGGRLDLRLDYTAQGLMYTNNSDANTINNNLQAFGTAELYQDHFFVDAYGLITQVPITSSGRVDAGGLGTSSGGAGFIQSLFANLNLGLPGAQDLFYPIGLFSDLALTGNQTTSNNFGVSPYWRQNFGGWAEALLRYRYDEVRYSGQQESDGVPEVPDAAVESLDSQTNTIEFNLTSGRQFSQLTWNLDYFYQREEGQGDDEDPTDGNDDRRERVAGQVNYPLNPRWALLAEAGYENNQLTTFEDNRNGSYWGLGAAWTPSRFFTLSGLYGSNLNEVAVQWNPSARTNLRISRRDQAVGESPGVQWEGTFSHRSRYGVWSASYTEEVTNTQQLLGDGLDGGISDGQEPLPGSSGPFGLSDQDFLRKRFDAGVTYQRRRNSLGFSAFHESREFQDPTNDETAYGAGALWTWRFAPRTASFLGTGWEFDEPGDEQQNDYWVSVVGLARVFSPDAGGLVSYRYYRNDADPSDQSFRENRLNVRFSLRF